MNDFTKYAEGDNLKDTKKMSSIKSKEVVVVIVVVVIVVLLGFAYKLFTTSSTSNIKPYTNLGSGASPYQAVFLNNANASVYFGKVAGTSSHWLYLNDVFYLKLNGSNTSAKATSTSSQYSLVHLGPTLSYGPTDHMKINLSQVLFIEDLSSQSNVYKAIGKYYKSHPKK